MNRCLLYLTFIVYFAASAKAQHDLSLDSCRALALRHNKRMLISNEKKTAAHYEQKTAFTNFLPKLSATGFYMHNSKSVSLLSDKQEWGLSHLGSSIQEQLKNGLTQSSNLLLPNLQPLLQLMAETDIATPLNALGKEISQTLQTDTHHIWGGVITLVQPIYAGGKITAYNRIAQRLHEVAGWEYEQERQSVILSTDEAYWQVVSLVYKKKLAESYLHLVTTLKEDVIKLTNAGMATLADELAIDVKANEADMTLSQIEDGLALSRMNLCQLCGLPLNDSIHLSDELPSSSEPPSILQSDMSLAKNLRPELQCLTLATDIYQEKIRLARSEHLPSVALTGNFLFSNPSILNGFQRKVRGIWNIGVQVHIPIFHWGESIYKVRKARAKAHASQYELEEAQELVALQIRQATYQADEAYKRMALANRNRAKAQENLRIANLGFKEGVIPSYQVLEAQTAWLSAQSAHIDALINIRITETRLRKAEGIL